MHRAFAVIALVFAVSLAGAEDLPFVLIPTVTSAPALDGTLADPVWQQAAVLPAFVMLDGASAPTQQTQVRLGHDSERLYLGVVCREDRLDRIQRSASARDGAVWSDDCVEVFIGGADPDTYYHLALNSVGTVADEKCTSEGKNLGWNCDFRVSTGRREGAWTATASLPLQQVGLEPGRPARLNLCRSEVPHREASCWSATLRGFHQPSRFGHVTPGTTPAAVTTLDWGTPWPGSNTLTCTAQSGDSLAPALSLTAAGKTQALALTPAGPGKFTYRFSAAGPIRLDFEAKAAGVLLSRQSFLLGLKDYQPELSALRQRLASLPPAARKLPAVDQTQKDLQALQVRAKAPESMTPQEWGNLADQVTALGRRVDGLRLRGASITASGQDAYGLGVQSPLVKMLRDDSFSGEVEAPLRLSAARHEYEAAQLVIFAFDKPLHQVSLEFSDLRGMTGQRPFSSANLTWRRVGYIPTEKPSYSVPFVGLWPDPLLPTAPFEVAASSFESVWVSVYVPRGTQPGDYQGTVTVRPQDAPARTVPVKLHVYGFTLPRTNHIKTSFGCGITSQMDRRKWYDNMLAHRISPTRAAGATVAPPRFDLSAYDRLAFSVRVASGAKSAKVRLIVGSEKAPQVLYGPLSAGEAWQEFVVNLPAGREAIQSLGLQLTEAADVTLEVKDLRAVGAAGALRIAPQASQWYGGAGSEVSQGADGSVLLAFRNEARPGEWLQDWPTAYVSVWEAGNKPASMDFSAFDEYVDRYQRLGLSAFAVGVPSTGYRQEVGQALRRLRESGTAAVAAGWEKHLRERGLLPMAYTYMADEPEPEYFATLNTILAEVHRGAPGLGNMMTARGAGAKGLTGVDIWCPEVYSFNPDGAAQEQAKGREVWWYVAYSTRHPFPNYWVDYPALDCRVLWWMSWKHNLDGILYWSINYRSERAWETAGLYPGANGDGHLVYPGSDGGVVDSIRWEAIRDGAEDYEYLWLLREGVRLAEERGVAADLLPRARALLAIDDTVVRSFKDYNPDPSRLLAKRDEMGAVLEALCRALGGQPAEVPLQTRRVLAPTAPESVTATPEVVQMPVGKDALALSEASTSAGALYRFEGSEGYIRDDSGAGNHGIVVGGERTAGRFGQGLKLSGDRSCVTMPSASTLLGPKSAEGTLALWVKPDYDPLQQSEDTWSGWTVFLYAQRTSGNGLPDGYNEIGLSAHGKTLFGKVNTSGDYSSYPRVAVPLRQGVWTHLALTWTPQERVLYVDGKPVARTKGNFEPTILDSCPVLVGKHPPTSRWNLKGTVDDVLVTPRALTAEQIAALSEGKF